MSCYEGVGVFKFSLAPKLTSMGKVFFTSGELTIGRINLLLIKCINSCRAICGVNVANIIVLLVSFMIVWDLVSSYNPELGGSGKFSMTSYIESGLIHFFQDSVKGVTCGSTNVLVFTIGLIPWL